MAADAQVPAPSADSGSHKVLASRNGKPSARAGRKATGLSELAGLPRETVLTGTSGRRGAAEIRRRTRRFDAMTARTLLTRFIPAAVVAAALLAPAAAQARGVNATVALGAKRPAKAHVAADCQNTDVLPTAQNAALVVSAILCLHNQIRAQRDLPALKLNGRLSRAAAGHSTDMVSDGYFDHTAPGGSTFVDRILRAGYAKRTDGWALGENLAWGTGDLSTASGVMNSWMASPGHKANILKRSYREVGIGIRLGVPSDGTVGATYTTDFGVKL